MLAYLAHVQDNAAAQVAALRAVAPLAQNDGLNFLRLGRAAPFGLHYFEVGNEQYGSWEVDRHGQGGDTGLPHDPATYVRFAKRFADYAELLHGQALLAEGSTLSDPARYAKLVADLMLRKD